MTERGFASAELAEQLGQVLASIEVGELLCSAATRHRIEGARLAMRVLASSPEYDRIRDTLGPIME